MTQHAPAADASREIHMNEKPILFNTDMVRAILNGRKTQTRRVMPQYLCFRPTNFRMSEGVLQAYVSVDEATRIGMAFGGWHSVVRGAGDGRFVECPYGNPGDRLWVREAFSAWFSGNPWREFPRDKRTARYASNVFYRATHPYPDDDQKWIPGIHMPRWASRLSLEIVSVSVERIQGITEEDARQEGVEPVMRDTGGVEPSGLPCPEVPCYGEAFSELWDRINSKRGFGWEKNPWVWCLKFRKVLA